MKSRIITGVVGVALIFVVLLLFPPIALNIAMVAVCAMAMFELLSTTHHVQHKGVLAASILFSACTPFFMLGESRMPAFLLLLIYVAVLVFFQILYHQTLKVEQTGDVPHRFFLLGLSARLQRTRWGVLRLSRHYHALDVRHGGVFYRHLFRQA